MTRYVITDPCYLINKDKWQELCEKASGGDEFDSNKFNDLVREELEIITQDEAWVSETGYGDWDNNLYGDEDTMLTHEFYADSGTVCVCKFVEDIENELKKHMSEPYPGAAIFEVGGKLAVDIDVSDPDWTYIEMSDDSGNSWNTMLSPFAEEDEEGGCDDEDCYTDFYDEEDD